MNALTQILRIAFSLVAVIDTFWSRGPQYLKVGATPTEALLSAIVFGLLAIAWRPAIQSLGNPQAPNPGPQGGQS